MKDDNIVEIYVENNEINIKIDQRYYEPLTDDQKEKINKLAVEMIETLNKPDEVLS